ncbi:hypothetical protein BDN70DRAFT_290769 [Pholiota conissans]|uniref:Uncharacterized protein n=1 Tax=Pholiota conissans TaxID=109636 RepID=A0A9P5Z8S3_9AGAR|nr:hypothetical protein BDN70DRAFT_290769 [Pholiota conissans]
MNGKSFRLPRFIILVSSIVLGIIVLGLCAHVRSKPSLGSNCGFDIMGMVTGALTLIAFPIMLMFTSTIFVLAELLALCVMWILWVVSAALSIEAREDVLGDRSCHIFRRSARTSCHEMVAIEAISIIIFVILMFYMVPLFCFAVFAHFHQRDKGIWRRRINEPSPVTCHPHSEIKAAENGTVAH